MTVPGSSVAILGRLPCAAYADEDSFGGAMAACFREDGVVAQARAAAGLSFHPNEAQELLADRYARAMWRGLPRALTGHAPGRGRVTMIEGATGTGKTLAYLVPAAIAALASGRPSIVATNTLTLQRQILDEEAAVARAVAFALTGRTLRVAALQGLGNYVSLSAVEALADPSTGEGADGRRTTLVLRDLAAWARGSLEGKTSGVLRDFLEERGLDRLPGGLAGRSVCFDGASPPEERVAYLHQREAANDAHIVLVTHAWLLTALRYHRPLLPAAADMLEASACGACVCDEAHLLPSVAEDALSTEVSLGTVGRRVQAAVPFAADGRRKRLQSTLEGADAALAALRDGAAALRADLAAVRQTSWADALRARPHRCATLVETASRAAVAISSLAGALRGLRHPEAQLLAQDLLADHVQMEDFVVNARRHAAPGNAPRSLTASLSWSPVLGLPRLHLTPHFPGRLIAQLWDEHAARGPLLDSVVMTSATLRTPGIVRGGGFEVALNEIAAFHEARTANADLNCSVEPKRFGTMRVVLSDPEITPPVRAVAGADEDDETAMLTNPAWQAHAGAMAAAAWRTPRRARSRTTHDLVELPPNVLVLTTSYTDTEAIIATWRAEGQDFTLGGEAPRPGTPTLLAHRRGVALSDLVTAYRAAARRRISGTQGGGIMVTPVGWEGLDLLGLVAHNVITRLPWPPPPSEAEIQALAERLGNRDRTVAVLQGNRRSRMLRRLRQGIGRGIRTPKDACTVWFADPRVPPPAARRALDMRLQQGPGIANDAALALPSRFAGAYAAATLWSAASSLPPA